MKNLNIALRSLFKKGRSNGIKILSLGVGLAMGLVLLGMAGAWLACLLTGSADTYCLSLSLLLAFAMLYPELQVLLFFVIPLKVKYFGIFAAALWVFSFLSMGMLGKLNYLLCMLGFLLFFGPQAWHNIRAWVRREQWKRKNRR